MQVEETTPPMTTQSLKEHESVLAEEIEISTSSSVPTGLTRRNVATNKETILSNIFSSDLDSESFHDATDYLPEFPVLDSSFDESEFRTPAGRLSTDSGYSTGASSSFASERDRAFVSNVGLELKPQEQSETFKGAASPQPNPAKSIGRSYEMEASSTVQITQKVFTHVTEDHITKTCLPSENIDTGDRYISEYGTHELGSGYIILGSDKSKQIFEENKFSDAILVDKSDGSALPCKPPVPETQIPYVTISAATLDKNVIGETTSIKQYQVIINRFRSIQT